MIADGFRADLNGLVDQQVTNLTYLAIGYAHNLGITKIPRELLKQIGLDHAPDDVRNGKIQQNLQAHSSDEMRAFLGCYYLMSMYVQRQKRCNDTHLTRN